jgi:hypothetical protein
MKEIGSGRESHHVVDDQIQIIQVGSEGFKEICRNAARGAVKHERELRICNRIAGKLSGRSAAGDDLFDRVLGNPLRLGKLQRSHETFRRRNLELKRLPAPGCDLFRRV